MSNDYERGYADGMAAALQAAGKTNGVTFEVKLDDSGAVIPNVVIQDNRIMRDYSVTMRRPCWQFAREEISAVDARDAVAKMRAASQDVQHVTRWDWDETDIGDVDWVQAERVDIDAAPDHADWEEPKPSPGVLVKALNEIVAIDERLNASEQVSSLQDFNDVIAIARDALKRMLPS